jgi:hypothetical protein
LAKVIGTKRIAIDIAFIALGLHPEAGFTGLP